MVLIMLDETSFMYNRFMLLCYITFQINLQMDLQWSNIPRLRTTWRGIKEE